MLLVKLTIGSLARGMMKSLVAGITTGRSATECAQTIVQEQRDGATIFLGEESVTAANATKNSNCKSAT